VSTFLQTQAPPPPPAATAAVWLTASAEGDGSGKLASWEHPWPPSFKGGQEQGQLTAFQTSAWRWPTPGQIRSPQTLLFCYSLAPRSRQGFIRQRVLQLSQTAAGRRGHGGGSGSCGESPALEVVTVGEGGTPRGLGRAPQERAVKGSIPEKGGNTRRITKVGKDL